MAIDPSAIKVELQLKLIVDELSRIRNILHAIALAQLGQTPAAEQHLAIIREPGPSPR
jgi:hypothetical protein